MFPLFVVVLVDALFQIYEDVGRHRADKEANASLAKKFDHESKSYVDVKWYELEVGDFVYIGTRSIVPADVVIISVAEKYEPCQGIAYVETKSLDGETNLKIRSALPNTLSRIRTNASIPLLTGELVCEHPNKFVDSFDGYVDFKDYGRDKIGANNVLLRGCVLRNTDWAIGLVVNSGHDTKIMMSSTEAKAKTSNLESKAGIEIYRIILLLATVCFAGATGLSIWDAENDVWNIWYLGNISFTPVSNWFISFFYFFLLHATFIPVSLYVSMAMVRSGQSYFMNQDLEMYYAPTDTPALVRTMTLNEELGQISHVFSDKTGTLTCNIMDFRKASIAGHSYGLGITEIGKAAWKLQGKDVPLEVLESETKAKQNCKDIPHVSFYDPKHEQHMAANGVEKAKINEFYRFLAICHDVIPEKIDGTIKLSASNPDDEALVCAASHFGFEFFDKHEKKILVKLKQENNRVEEIEVLDTIVFTSKRKRMSIIIRDADRKIRIISKGADTAMIPRFKVGQDSLLSTTNNHLKQFSLEGLRCLFIGTCVIDEEEYDKWHSSYTSANTNMAELDKKKKGLPNRIETLEDEIENNLLLVGATAIEDRLQDGVPECIESLVNAGVNIWMLTGDKEETAINIAVACNLVRPTKYMDHIIVNTSTCPTRQSMMDKFTEEISRYENDRNKRSLKPRALIIDGAALIVAMDPQRDDNLKQQLLELTLQCKAVVCCRVSPDQKRQMVNMVKVGRPDVRTLAIGDGANDVAMIQEAHIGVGIKGEEGVQAVNSSDYAIAQFRYLSSLMLKHGRYNYIRMCILVCYMFYKNVLMSMGQFWFNFNNGFSGQKYYTEGFIQLFNLAFTSMPIILLSIYDMDIKPSFVFQYPQLYRSGINGENFKPILFWSWIGTAMCESVIMSVLPLYFLDNSNVKGSSFWESGATCFTVVVFVVSSKICFVQGRFYWFNWAVILLSILLFFLSGLTITYNVDLDDNWFYVFDSLLNDGSFYLSVILITLVIVGKDLFLHTLDRTFNYKPYQIIQEIEYLEELRPTHVVLDTMYKSESNDMTL